MGQQRSIAASTDRYRAFLSYSHADRGWASWLHKALETYRVPSRLVGAQTLAGVIPRRLSPIFRDREELASAADLGAKVNEALERSDNLIVVCSPRSAASRWVNEEVLAFKRLGREARIFCLIVDGEPNATDLPGRAAEECFAPALRFQLAADGALSERRAEPIAADARPDKDGKANATLKLVAGVLGVGFDTLKQREQHRRMRRMAAITTLALAVTLVTTALAIDALIERHAAVVAQQAALRRQRQAEHLVRFMLGDLNDKLALVGRLDIMQAVDDKAMAYFKSLPTADVTDQTLAQRVKALQEIGTVRENQGQLASALQSYRAAAGLAGELLRRDPTDVMREARYATSLTWIGRVHWYQGNLGKAARDFRTAARLLGKAVAARPGDTKLTEELSAAQVNTGRVLEAHGDFTAAEPYYRAARDNFRRLIARNPTNSRWPLQLAYAYDDLGKLALEEGDLVRAITDYRTDQRLKSALAAREPGNRAGAQEGLLVSNAILGRTLGLCGETRAAVHFTAMAVASARKLVAFDKTEKYWVDFLGFYSQQLGALLRQLGHIHEAETDDGEAARLVSGLVARNPTNTFWQQQLAQIRLESARLQLARNDATAAQAAALEAQATASRLLSKSPGDRSLMLLAAQTDLILGQTAAAHGDRAAAGRYWARARDTILPATRSGADPNVLAVYAEALLRLDAVGAARPIVTRLNEMGYRTRNFVALVNRKRLDYPVNVEFLRRIMRVMRGGKVTPQRTSDVAGRYPSPTRRAVGRGANQ